MCPRRRRPRRAALVRGRRLRRSADPRRSVAIGELCRRFRHGAAGRGAPSAGRCQRQRSDRHRPPSSPADRRAAVGATRRHPRRARGLSGPLRLPEPRAARCRWGQSRHLRRDVAMVGVPWRSPSAGEGCGSFSRCCWSRQRSRPVASTHRGSRQNGRRAIRRSTSPISTMARSTGTARRSAIITGRTGWIRPAPG